MDAGGVISSLNGAWSNWKLVSRLGELPATKPLTAEGDDFLGVVATVTVTGAEARVLEVVEAIVVCVCREGPAAAAGA